MVFYRIRHSSIGKPSFIKLRKSNGVVLKGDFAPSVGVTYQGGTILVNYGKSNKEAN
jgi:hypothetical protein